MAQSGKDDKKVKTYSEEHDFMCVSIKELPKLVMRAYKVKQPLNLVGDSGIGKTEMVNQACKTLSDHYGEEVKCEVMIVSQLMPEDLMGIPMPDGEVVKFLKMARLPREGRGILFLDEWNQADSSIQKPLFQLLGERRVADYTLPEGWAIIAACNPDGGVYRTTPPTPAFRRRMAWVEVKFDHNAFIEYISNSWNDTLVDFLRANPEMCYNKESETANRVFANPASWEKVNNLLKTLGPDESLADIQSLACGLVGTTYFRNFYQFYKRNNTDVNARDVFTNYDNVRSKVKKLCEKGRVGQLTQITHALITYISSFSEEDSGVSFDKAALNVSKFFEDVLDDTATLFIKQLRGTCDNRSVIKWRRAMHKHKPAAVKMAKLNSIYEKDNDE